MQTLRLLAASLRVNIQIHNTVINFKERVADLKISVGILTMNIYGATDIGNRRSTNQDAFRVGQIRENYAYTIFCDCMGVVYGGEVASILAADTIKDYLDKNLNENDDEIISVIKAAIKEANALVFNMSVEKREYSGMGTTVVMAVIKDNKMYAAHIGDSRLYLTKEEETVQVTEDHSFVQTLVNNGEITKEQARVHPNKNIITRSLGVHSETEPDFNVLDVKEGEIAILCTDGLSDYLTEKLLFEISKKSSGEELVNILVKYALMAGGHDNITVSAVYF